MNEAMTISPASTMSAPPRRPADVLHPVGVGEAEIAIEARPEHVAVEDVGMVPEPPELALQGGGDRRLPGAGKSVSQTRAGL